jgi:hypothetical protein
MTTTAAALLLGTPLVALAVLVAGIRARSVRSLHADVFKYKATPLWIWAMLTAVVAGLYVAGHDTPATRVTAGVGILAIIGSGVVQSKVLGTLSKITRFYLDGEHWNDVAAKGPNWRYEMQHVFVTDPEYVDGLVLDLLEETATLAELGTRLKSDYPDKYRHILEKRVWGFMFPTVRTLALEVVPAEVFGNHGRFSPGKSADDIYAELRILACRDRTLLMDRWQYYWCLRNLNYIDSLINKVFSWWAVFATVALGALLCKIGTAVTPNSHLGGIDLWGDSVAAGLLLLMLTMCGSASLFIIAAFRGTGTFGIPSPSYDDRYDPLWSDVIQVGIVAFAISLVVYGIGGQFFFDPTLATHLHITTRVIGYACASLAFSGLVFACHIVGVHELMKDSKWNALDRIQAALASETKQQEREVLTKRFLDVRQLRVWPFQRATIAQLVAGIAFPIVVQVLLLYTGLKKG